MNEGLVIGGLATVMGLVLVLPFSVKKVEEELEAFLFIMGVLAVSISRLWSRHLVEEALIEPIKITLAVFFAGLIFKFIRPKLGKWTTTLAQRFGYNVLFFIIVVGLGLLSSVITAIIAALVLSEVISALRLPRSLEVKIVIISCFSIGLGAVLTPLGEPLSTIAVSKLKGEPYHADFFFLLRMLGLWVVPVILGLGFLPAFLKDKGETKGDTLTEDKPEGFKDVVIRALKVYLFVLALVFLGKGFTPVVDKYLVRAPAAALYWVNIVSAILDNATLTAAEISPAMSLYTIKCALAGLLIAGGMLIPGNIPNIICASKLSIKSKEWAVFGVPLGMVIMIGFFIVLMLV
jgi:predicted cation transporter